MKLNIPQSAEQQWSIQWSILNYWVKSKQAKFDELIINICNDQQLQYSHSLPYRGHVQYLTNVVAFYAT